MTMFSSMKIGPRLGLGFGMVLLIAAMMTAIGIWRLHDVAAATEDIRQLGYRERLSYQWQQGISTNAARTVAVAKSNDPETRKFFQAEIAAESAGITKVQKELEGLSTDAHVQALLAAVAEKRKAYLDIRNGIFKKQTDGSAAEVNQLVTDRMIPALNAYLQAVREVVQHNQQLVEAAGERSRDLESSGRQIMLTLGILALVAGALLAWILARSITRPLAKAVEVSGCVANGDLNVQIDISSRDETGILLQSLKNMTGNLAGIVGDVRAGTDTITTAAAHIAAGNQDLASRTEQQASSLEETASAMKEMTETVRQNAGNAQQANQLALAASEVAVRGGSVVGQVVGTMGSINESSKKIVDIISVIDGIAFQTNILALNAAVEAARAGEQGRGFAVVATEVRTLAQRSAAAAKEIKTLIDDSVGKVDAGSLLVADAGRTMEEVVQSIRKVTDIVGEIVAASRDQSSGIEQIHQAITQMDQVTQQNAALVEKAAAASQAMQDQAVTLGQSVSLFKLSASHAAAPSASADPAPALRSQAGQRAAPAKRIAAQRRTGKREPVMHERPGQF